MAVFGSTIWERCPRADTVGVKRPRIPCRVLLLVKQLICAVGRPAWTISKGVSDLNCVKRLAKLWVGDHPWNCRHQPRRIARRWHVAHLRSIMMTAFGDERIDGMLIDTIMRKLEMGVGMPLEDW